MPRMGGVRERDSARFSSLLYLGMTPTRNETVNLFALDMTVSRSFACVQRYAERGAVKKRMGIKSPPSSTPFRLVLSAPHRQAIDPGQPHFP